MKRKWWWQTHRKLGRIGRSIWFWEPETDAGWRRMGTDIKWTNRWVWFGPLEVCWLSREYMAEEGL